MAAPSPASAGRAFGLGPKVKIEHGAEQGATNGAAAWTNGSRATSAGVRRGDFRLLKIPIRPARRPENGPMATARTTEGY